MAWGLSILQLVVVLILKSGTFVSSLLLLNFFAFVAATGDAEFAKVLAGLIRVFITGDHPTSIFGVAIALTGEDELSQLLLRSDLDVFRSYIFLNEARYLK